MLVYQLFKIDGLILLTKTTISTENTLRETLNAWSLFVGIWTNSFKNSNDFLSQRA